ncbi:hypothetical protein ON010_g4614 [Phytophthora cinnamomi]|nr:hypothetical protein ON010_g4614 [Phytophthora cinnamomi]
MTPMRYKRYPQQVRACVLRAAEKGKDWKTAAKVHDVRERTTWGWVTTALDTGDWSGVQKRRGGSDKKIVDAYVDYLLSDLPSTPELTLLQMAELVEQMRISRETVRRAMDVHSFMLKKLHRDVVNRNSDVNKQKRYGYVVKFYAALSNNKKVFYLDETNFNLECSRGRDCSKRGQRAVQTSVASKVRLVHG